MSEVEFQRTLKAVRFGQSPADVAHRLGPPDVEENSIGHNGDEIVWRFAKAGQLSWSPRMFGEVYFRNGVVYETSRTRIYYSLGCGTWETTPPTLAALGRDLFDLPPPDSAEPTLDPCLDF